MQAHRIYPDGAAAVKRPTRVTIFHELDLVIPEVASSSVDLGCLGHWRNPGLVANIG